MSQDDLRCTNCRSPIDPASIDRERDLATCNATLKKADIQQLYSAKFGALYTVVANLKPKGSLRLVFPLITAEQALFIEQRLERALGIADVSVVGELGNEEGTLSVEGKQPPRGSKSVGFLVPLFILGVVGLFLFVASTEVSGKLQAGGALGSWLFEPDDCSSGQLEGFSGVTLTAKAHPGRQIRVVRDAVRGGLIVVASPGSANHVLGSDACQLLTVNVERGDTNINDVWVVNGSVSLKCADLTGSVAFEGCH